jgi:hypothetical protein
MRMQQTVGHSLDFTDTIQAPASRDILADALRDEMSLMDDSYEPGCNEFGQGATCCSLTAMRPSCGLSAPKSDITVVVAVMETQQLYEHARRNVGKIYKFRTIDYAPDKR